MGPPARWRPFARRRRRVRNISIGPAAVLHGILDKVVDDYRAVVAEIESHIQEVEAEVLSPQGVAVLSGSIR